jgi:hypothetical protein
MVSVVTATLSLAITLFVIFGSGKHIYVAATFALILIVGFSSSRLIFFMLGESLGGCNGTF